MLRFLVLAASLVTASVALAADGNVFNYTCGDMTLNATFNLSDDLTLVIGDRTYEKVPQVMSGSGAKCEMGEGADCVMFWDRGATALLQLGETEYPECKREAG